MPDLSEKVLKKQKIHLILVAAVIGFAVFGLIKYAYDHYEPTSYDLFEPRIDLPVDEFQSKEVWMDRLETQVGFLIQKQKYYEETLLEYKERERANEKEKIELKQYLTLLKKKMEASQVREEELKNKKDTSALEIASSSKNTFDRPVFEQAEESLLPPSSYRFPSSSFSSDPFVSQGTIASFGQEAVKATETAALRPPLCEYTLPQEAKNELFSLEKRTPANVSVRAILLSSVDAVCRLDAQSDPIPVKLRLLDDAHLPGGMKVKLKGCLIGASAYGDISSERVYMRLENLTQVNLSGQAIETEVTGYVSGEDGRFGMRGILVDRSAKILKPALGSGILSGIAQTLQSACARPSKETINTYSLSSDFAQNTVAKTSDAFSLLASYYIKRAEQVQPVLQIDAGRLVDVTFTQGFSMGDLHAKENLKQIRNKHRPSS